MTGKLTRAETLIDQAATTAGKKARKVRQKARNLLRQAGAKATRAAKGKKAKLSPSCAAALKDAAGRVAAGLLYRDAFAVDHRYATRMERMKVGEPR